eukprot:GHVU01218755.1.p5 GENE.GHVU01218755.1~~GHVU01218755.1.p5  ORF type:complete len:109 (-),score=20.50 GHVU01218755.1:83-409(-)
MPMTGKRKKERAPLRNPLRGTRKDEAAVQQAERRRSSASTGVPSSVHPADRPARRFQQPPPSTSDSSSSSSSSSGRTGGNRAASAAVEIFPINSKYNWRRIKIQRMGR